MTALSSDPRVLRGLALFTIVTIAACTGRPAAVRPPSIDSSGAGELAMEQYDSDGDGLIKGAELDRVPALKSALPRFDANQDSGVSADEIAQRIDVWQNAGLGLTSCSFTVTLDGKPVPEAVVIFEPEAFLGDELKAAKTVTTSAGGGSPTIPPEDRPDPTYPPGMHLGLYKVKVSKIVDGKETIPSKYNEKTTLGQEVSPDVPEIINRKLVYALTSD